MFFFEKKNQKTFGLWRRLPGERTRQRTKVFCFFSSEKKNPPFLQDIPMHRLLLAASLLLPVPCFAHAFLDGAEPRVGSESPVKPAQVTLHFTQGVEPAFSRIEVQNAAGASVTDGAPATEPNDPTHFFIKLKPITPGTYTVIWHVTSVDTHKTQGTFHFTVTP
jgi:methionine-rich copper-binding protein CopC